MAYLTREEIVNHLFKHAWVELDRCPALDEIRPWMIVFLREPRLMHGPFKQLVETLLKEPEAMARVSPIGALNMRLNPEFNWLPTVVQHVRKHGRWLVPLNAMYDEPEEILGDDEHPPLQPENMPRVWMFEWTVQPVRFSELVSLFTNTGPLIETNPEKDAWDFDGRTLRQSGLGLAALDQEFEWNLTLRLAQEAAGDPNQHVDEETYDGEDDADAMIESADEQILFQSGERDWVTFDKPQTMRRPKEDRPYKYQPWQKLVGGMAPVECSEEEHQLWRQRTLARAMNLPDDDPYNQATRDPRIQNGLCKVWRPGMTGYDEKAKQCGLA